jgi:hypothetical protein
LQLGAADCIRRIAAAPAWSWPERLQADEERMKDYLRSNFDERRQASASAKKEQLEKLKAKLNAVDPDKVAARMAAEAARSERDAKRRAEREAVIAAEKAAQAAREAEEAARREAERAAAEAAAREEAGKLDELRAAQKAARDARYAARKKRKRRG